MTAINLSRRLVLETPQNVADGAGGYSVNWVALGTLWGELRAGAGRETTATEVNLSAVSYRITVRGAPMGSDARPKPEQRLRDDTRLFTILAVTERDPQGQYLTCFAREEVPA